VPSSTGWKHQPDGRQRHLTGTPTQLGQHTCLQHACNMPTTCLLSSSRLSSSAVSGKGSCRDLHVEKRFNYSIIEPTRAPVALVVDAWLWAHRHIQAAVIAVLRVAVLHVHAPEQY
jgi:hypothetical protein